MTSHLTPEQFVDALERPMPADRQAHLAVCDECATSLAEMQALMTEVTLASEVPEPSPLFWDHLSARVREAVDAVPAPLPWWRTSWRTFAVIGGALSAVVIAFVMSAAPPAQPVPTSAMGEATAERVASIPMSAESEAMFSMIEGLAGSVQRDQAFDAGMRPGSTATAAAIESLTPAQRQQLMKLLRAEMGSAE
jgi:anti-sigma factor RsiW